MTRSEAESLLEKRFPKKKFYISCHCWNDNGRAEPPKFSIYVYDAFGKGLNAGKDGQSIAEAVKATINQTEPNCTEGIADVEAMFASV